jgi:hypothetical protein
MRPWVTSKMARRRSVTAVDRNTYPEAPVDKALSATFRSSSYAKNMILGGSSCLPSSLAAWSPDSRGRQTPVITISGLSLGTASIKDNPSSTPPTTSTIGSRRWRMKSAVGLEASATRTRSRRATLLLVFACFRDLHGRDDIPRQKKSVPSPLFSDTVHCSRHCQFLQQATDGTHRSS